MILVAELPPLILGQSLSCKSEVSLSLDPPPSMPLVLPSLVTLLALFPPFIVHTFLVQYDLTLLKSDLRPICDQWVVVSCSLILKSLLANPRYLTEIHRPPHEFEKLVSVPETISLFPDTEKPSRLARLTCTRSVVSTKIRDIKMNRTAGEVVRGISSNEIWKI